MLPLLSFSRLPVVRPDFANLHYPCFPFLLPHPARFQRPFCHLVLSLPASRLLVSTPRMRSHSHCAADPAPAHLRSGPFGFLLTPPSLSHNQAVLSAYMCRSLRPPLPLCQILGEALRQRFNHSSVDSFPNLPPVQG